MKKQNIFAGFFGVYILDKNKQSIVYCCWYMKFLFIQVLLREETLLVDFIIES